METQRVTVVMFDGMSSFHLAIPCLIFGQDRTSLGLPQFELSFYGVDGDVPRTDNGFIVPCGQNTALIEDADIVVIPSWGDLVASPPKALLQALKVAHARGAVVAGLCLGAFPVAASGLLDGAMATTHWAYAQQLAEFYPGVTVDAKVIYVNDGRIYTSAGVAAGLDCCLHIVRELYGSAAATQLARQIVMSPHRLGGQAQLIEAPVPKPRRDDRFAMVLDQVRANLAAAHSLDDVAAAANMTRRTFTRRFTATYAMSFGAWIGQERGLLARHLLETTEMSVEDVALKAGFGTTATLRTHFARQFQIAPTLHRRAFSQKI